MTRRLSEQPYAIHVGVSDDLLTRFETDARSAAMSVIALDLSEAFDSATLADYLSKVFMFPHETRGLDAAVDLISDLEWFGNTSGYLIVVNGLDRTGDEVVESFAGILPNIVDRWRSQGQAFIVAIRGSCERLTSTLAVANRQIEQAGSLPWAQPGTRAVEVVLDDDQQQLQ